MKDSAGNKEKAMAASELHGSKRKADKFKFNWEGCLSDIDENISYVDLQHCALEWRTES